MQKKIKKQKENKTAKIKKTDLAEKITGGGHRSHSGPKGYPAV